MRDTVLLSWQDDLPSESNREFIRNCLADAINQVSEALNVEDMERPDLDHDTKGTPEMVAISQTILEKIQACALMVADVTPVATTERGKFLPNPNVMVELGYAIASRGFDRIIAILNTANGSKVETLPLDIRHRRILTYALDKNAPKDERKAAKEDLIPRLVDAIKTNINEVRSENSAREEKKGADSDQKTYGLWKANWPMEHSGSDGTLIKVTPIQVPRAWLRVIPLRFDKGIPPVSAIEKLPDDTRLWAPGGRRGADWGPCKFGFVTYQKSREDEEGTRQVYNLAAFLEETGEIWKSDGEAFWSHDNPTKIDCDNLLSNWARGFENSIKCLDALGASKNRRVIVGIERLDETFWPQQARCFSAQSRKPRMDYEATKHDWSVQEQTDFLMAAWNELRNVYSLDPMTPKEFTEYYENRKRS